MIFSFHGLVTKKTQKLVIHTIKPRLRFAHYY